MSAERQRRPLNLTLTREAVLRDALKSLDGVRDAVTGEPLPRTSRDRALFELYAIFGYLDGQGIERELWPAIHTLWIALGDAKRGVAHPMLTPERPQDPNPKRAERKKGGAPQSGAEEVHHRAIAAVSVSVLLFHGHRKDPAAELVSGELRRRGIEIEPKDILRLRDELDCKKHKLVTSPVWLTSSMAEKNSTPGRPVSWMQPPEPMENEPRLLPSTNTIAQRRYDSTWPYAEQHFMDLKELGVSDSEAAELAVERILDRIAPPPGGKISNRAENILQRFKMQCAEAAQNREQDTTTEKSRKPLLLSEGSGDDPRQDGG